MSLLYQKIVQEDLDVGTSSVTVTNPGGGSLSGTQLGLHSVGVGQVSWTDTWDAAPIAAAGYEATSITVPGAAEGDFVLVSLASMLTDDMMISGHVSAPDTVKVVLFNPTAASVDLADGTLRVIVFKSR